MPYVLREVAITSILKDRDIRGVFITVDVYLCEYTSHGHYGILRDNGSLNNQLSDNRISDVEITYA